jgi:CheY-like chemotaxis protein
MKIVLLNDKKIERDAMLRVLASAKYSVEGVADEQTALTVITRDSPHMVLFALPSKGGADLVRRLRGADASGEAYLIALTESAVSSRELATVMDAGAQDFLRRPVVDVELLERLKAPSRVVRWVKSLAKSAAFDLASPSNLRGLEAWSGLGPLVARDLSEVAGKTFAVSKEWPARFTQGLRCATIAMSLAGEQVETRISIVADDIAVGWIKTALLGGADVNGDAVDDALRELANTAGGALKRAALSENVALTTGIPFSETPRPALKSHDCWTLKLDTEDGCLALVAEIRERANQRVAASELSEGMILAHDVRNEGGILLAPAGSRLTSTTANKLAEMLGPRFFLEVAPAA